MYLKMTLLPYLALTPNLFFQNLTLFQQEKSLKNQFTLIWVARESPNKPSSINSNSGQFICRLTHLALVPVVTGSHSPIEH